MTVEGRRGLNNSKSNDIYTYLYLPTLQCVTLPPRIDKLSDNDGFIGSSKCLVV